VPARILDGKKLASELQAEIAAGVVDFRLQAGRPPGLAVILVGEDAASAVYVRNKTSSCKKLGIESLQLTLSASVTQAELLDTIDRLNDDPAIDAMLVQLPLPRHIDEQVIIKRIAPAKDVDGFHPENVGLLSMGRPKLVPCTPLGIQVMLTRLGIDTRGKEAVVLGRSNIVGKPMAALLSAKGPGGDATVTICHTATRDVVGHARRAEILIAAMGRPEIVRGDWIKPGAVVIDVGIHRRDDGTLCGDVAFEEACHVAGAITPVPGGVGPITVAMLLSNTLKAACSRAGIEKGSNQ
jgi:methylenetetrahydrofolate dehydrogenase (NADP+) / methenyltetrahydrofolate cyclohydrolase